MADLFYFNENGDKIGPLNANELTELISTGIVKKGTTVDVGGGKTVPAIKIKQFQPIFQRLDDLQTVPVPPASTDELVYKENSIAYTFAKLFDIGAVIIVICFVITIMAFSYNAYEIPHISLLILWVITFGVFKWVSSLLKKVSPKESAVQHATKRHRPSVITTIGCLFVIVVYILVIVCWTIAYL